MTDPTKAARPSPRVAVGGAGTAPVGSGRRVNFDASAAQHGGSARRLSEGYNNYGSSSRKLLLAQSSSPQGGGGVVGGAGGLTPSALEEPTATQSAVSMNSIFSEARREIRRGHARDSAIRSAEYQRVASMGGEEGQGSVPTTPAQQRDLEVGGAPAAPAASTGGFDWAADVAGMKAMFESSWILTCLLICIPLGAAAHYTRIGGVSAIFTLNFLAIIPLAWLLGNATEELAMRSNQTIGGLLNATFGNAVELIVSIVALQKGMIKLVQASLLGSILSNCLLVLGMAFLLGGLKNKTQTYNHKGANILSSLLLLATIALVLPAAFVNSFQMHPSMAHLLLISRMTAAIMFVIYLLYLYFQLYTHSEMFSDEAEWARMQAAAALAEEARTPSPPLSVTRAGANVTIAASPSPRSQQQKKSSLAAPKEVAAQGYQASSRALGARESAAAGGDASEEDDGVEEVEAVSDHMKELSDLSPPRRSATGAPRPASIAEGHDEESHHLENGRHGAHVDEEDDEDEEDDDDDDGADEPTLSLYASLSLLILVTLTVALSSDYLVGSIEEVTHAWGMNVSFVGVILIPIVGNAAEHATAITVAMKNKMDLSIGVAIGSSTQIALFLIPFVTLLGWVLQQPMSLNFSNFETISLVVSVLMVGALLKNGESNWLQGVMLIAVYLVISVAFLYVPPQSDDPRVQNHASSWTPSDAGSGTSHVRE